MNKSHLLRYGSVIFLTFCIVRIAWWVLPNTLGVWEFQANDQFMLLAQKWKGNQQTTPDIVHIDLDDQSVSSLPYSKNDPRLYAELIRLLSASGVKAVLVDMLFPKCVEGGCLQLVKEVRKAGNVLFPVILSPVDKNEVSNPEIKTDINKAFWTIQGQVKSKPASGRIMMTNYASLNEAAAGLGQINCPPDPDGVYRRIPLFMDTPTGLIPSLALRTVCKYLGIPPESIRFQNRSYLLLENVTLPTGATLDIRIPISSNTNNRINFSGPWNSSFAHYSLATIINEGTTAEGRMNLMDELEDTLAIVSDVSTGGRDFGPVPLSSYSPLSNLHAHFANSVLTDHFLSESNPIQNLLIDLGLIILLTAAALFFKGYRFALISGVLFCGFIAACYILFQEQRILVPVVRPSLSFVPAVLSIMLLQFLAEQKEKQYIRATLANYFAPSVMEKILNDPEMIKGVKRKELTVLFSDIVGFSTWSSTKGAEEIHRTLNRYFEEMAEIVFAHEGSVDKYIGDGLMVFFGDPNPLPDHARRAVEAARAMQKKTRELRSEWEKTGGMPIEIRIGIHCGEMVVGNMGSHSRMDYTVIGSNVNLAQRLESNCPQGGILISEEVYKQLDSAIHTQPAGSIKAKGFPEPIPVYTVDPE